jgi:hypothetical protein
MLPASRGVQTTNHFQRKEKIMNYTKPELAVLGEAVRVIENHMKGQSGTYDAGTYNLQPAYDLDE